MQATQNFDAKTARRVLFAVCLSMFYLPFMMAGVNAVLPPIGISLHASAQELGMVGSFYTLGLAIAQLAAGRMGDVWGRKRLYLTGMLLFSLTALAQGFTSSLTLFMFLRFVQGCGGALFNAASLALLASVAPSEMRGRYLGISGAAVYAGIAFSSPLAGLITGTLGWRWLFFACAAASAANALLMFCSVKTEWRISKGEPFDWQGCLYYAAAMSVLVYGSTLLHSSLQLGGGLMLVALCLLALFCRHSWRNAYPLLQLRLFTDNRTFRLSSLAAFINYSSLFALMFFFSMYLQVVQGYSVQAAGLLLSVQAVIQAGLCPMAGTWADKYGAGRLSALGIALCGLGILCAVFLHQESGLWHVLLVQLIMGVGISIFAIPNTTIILDSVASQYLGQASSVTGAVRTGGMLISMIILTVSLGVFLGEAPATKENIPQFLHAMRTDFIIFGLLNLAAIGCALAREAKKAPKSKKN
jgi:MFS family permease